jgi:2-phosphoglycerate kinase
VTDPTANATDTSLPAVEWVRKRDGEVVRFEPEKLARSLRLAAEELAEPLPLETLDEVARMAMFFVRANTIGDIVESSDLADCVEKSLGETGQTELAARYAQYRSRKCGACEQLKVFAERADDREAPMPAERWSKSRIVETLRARIGLDARHAREIASRVERTVLAARWTRLTTDLVREVVNNE